MYYEKRSGTWEKEMSRYNSEISKCSVLTILFYITPSREIATVLVCATNKKNPLWKIVGGKVNEGESIIAAAERETLEETGLEVINTTVAKRISRPSHIVGMPTHHQFVLFSEIIDITKLKPTTDDDEDILETGIFNLDEILKYLKLPKPINGRKILTPHANIYRDLFIRNKHTTEELITRNFS